MFMTGLLCGFRGRTAWRILGQITFYNRTRFILLQLRLFCGRVAFALERGGLRVMLTPTLTSSTYFVGGLEELLLARLFSHHKLCLPIWPVGIRLPDRFRVLTVSVRGTNHCLAEVLRRSEGCVAGEASGKPVRHFLKHPAIAVRILEGNERKITDPLWLRTTDPCAYSGKSAGGSGFTVIN